MQGSGVSATCKTSTQEWSIVNDDSMMTEEHNSARDGCDGPNHGPVRLLTLPSSSRCHMRLRLCWLGLPRAKLPARSANLLRLLLLLLVVLNTHASSTPAVARCAAAAWPCAPLSTRLGGPARKPFGHLRPQACASPNGCNTCPAK
jgi:hypothetical protein